MNDKEKMMGILDKLTDKPTRMERHSMWPEPPLLTVDDRTTEREKGYGFGTQSEHILSGTVQVNFWCNPAQYFEARREAEKLLVIRLYGDFIPHLFEARKAIADGDQRAALAALSKMQTELGI